MILINDRGTVAINGRYVVEVNIHHRDSKKIMCTCVEPLGDVCLASYDSEEKARIAFGRFKHSLMEGSEFHFFPDNDGLDDLIKANNKKGYGKTTGKTK